MLIVGWVSWFGMNEDGKIEVKVSDHGVVMASICWTWNLEVSPNIHYKVAIEVCLQLETGLDYVKDWNSLNCTD